MIYRLGLASFLGVVAGLAVLLATPLVALATSDHPGGHPTGGEQASRPTAATSGDESVQWIAEKIGQYLPLDLQFTDEEGKPIRLGEIIDRPTIFLPIYFDCSNICSRNLAKLAASLNRLSMVPAQDYRVIALSFNEEESFQDAARAKRNYLKIVGDGFPPSAWRFLTGKKEAILAATEAVGFRFQKVDEETILHPAALMIISDSGKIIRYVYGSFLPGDIDLGLADARRDQPSISVRRLLAFCFDYDPRQNSSVFTQVKIGVLVFFGLVLSYLFFHNRRKKTRGRQAPRNDFKE